MMSWIIAAIIGFVTIICCIVIAKVTGNEKKTMIAGVFALLSAAGFGYAISKMIQDGLGGLYLIISIIVGIIVPVLIFMVIYRIIRDPHDIKEKKRLEGQLDKEKKSNFRMKKEIRKLEEEQHEMEIQLHKQKKNKNDEDGGKEKQGKKEQNLQRIYEQSIADTKEEYEEEIKKRQADYIVELAKAQTDHEDALERERADFEERLSKERESFIEDLEKFKHMHESEISKVQADYRNVLEKFEDQQNTIERYENQHDEFKSEIETALAAAKEAEEDLNNYKQSAKEREEELLERIEFMEKEKAAINQRMEYARNKGGKKAHSNEKLIEKAEMFRSTGKSNLAAMLYEQCVEKAETDEERRMLQKTLADCYIEAGEPGRAKKLLSEG